MSGSAHRGGVRAWLSVALLLAGCVSPSFEPEPADLPASGATIPFGLPSVAISGCSFPPTQPCHEPSVVALPDGTLVVSNAYESMLGRAQQPGAEWQPIPRPRPLAAPLSGGDILLQLAPDGSLWWSALAGDVVALARSADGGLTWTEVPAAPFGLQVDRQWLAFVDGDVVVVSIQSPEGVFAVSSRDGGGSWSDPVKVGEKPIHGSPAVVGSRILLPRFDYGTTRLVASVSDDGGGTWSDRVVAGPSHIGDFFPMLAAEGPLVHAAWKSGERLLLASSEDGGETWGPATRLSLEGERVVSSPWILARDHAVVVAYFTAPADEGPARLHVARLREGDVERGVAADGIATTLREDRPGNTDFAHADLTLDGRLVVAYADGDGAVKVAIERR